METVLDDDLTTSRFDSTHVYTVSIPREPLRVDWFWVMVLTACGLWCANFAFRTQWRTQRKSRLPPGKFYFRPTTSWQEVLSDHVIPNGLELRMDFETGRNYARLLPGQKDIAVPDYCDEAAVVKRLCDEATWGRPDNMRQLLGSCYYRPVAMTRPLCEAAGRGHVDVCEVLIRARADPLGRAPQGLTPLHCAAGEGHEHVAAILLERCLDLGRVDALSVRDDRGRSCLDSAREQDLGPVARRIEAAFSEAMRARGS